jgi:hypothetical protein
MNTTDQGPSKGDAEQPADDVRPRAADPAVEGIPPQYRGLSSELVEELWTSAESVDPQRRTQDQERRASALEALRQQEIAREAQKEESFRQQYARLTPEQRGSRRMSSCDTMTA